MRGPTSAASARRAGRRARPGSARRPTRAGTAPRRPAPRHRPGSRREGTCATRRPAAASGSPPADRAPAGGSRASGHGHPCRRSRADRRRGHETRAGPGPGRSRRRRAGSRRTRARPPPSQRPARTAPRSPAAADSRRPSAGHSRAYGSGLGPGSNVPRIGRGSTCCSSIVVVTNIATAQRAHGAGRAPRQMRSRACVPLAAQISQATAGWPVELTGERARGRRASTRCLAGRIGSLACSAQQRRGDRQGEVARMRSMLVAIVVATGLLGSGSLAAQESVSVGPDEVQRELVGKVWNVELPNGRAAVEKFKRRRHGHDHRRPQRPRLLAALGAGLLHHVVSRCATAPSAASPSADGRRQVPRSTSRTARSR